MRDPSSFFQPAIGESATFSLSWGQVIFVGVWLLACVGARWWQGAWPSGWGPLAYVLPAAIIGLSWDLTVGRAFALRPALRIFDPKL